MVVSIRQQALVVDDSQLDRTVLGRLLESLGHQVTLCSNGREAVQLYARKDCTISCIWMATYLTRKFTHPPIAKSERRYGVGVSALQGNHMEIGLRTWSLVQDINMPILDGLQATRQIRNIERTRMAHDQGPREYSGVSACSKTEQHKSAASDGLFGDCPTEQQPWELYGMDMFIEKPVDGAKLRRILKQLEAI